MANGIQQVPTGLEPVLAGLQQLAAGIGEAAFPEEQRVQQIQDLALSNPEIARNLAVSVRRAQEGEGDPSQLAGVLGVSEERIPDLAAGLKVLSPETFQEQVGAERARRPGLPEAAVDVEESALGAEAATTEARRLGALVAQEGFEAARQLDLPQLEQIVRQAKLGLERDLTQEEQERVKQYGAFMQSIPEDQTINIAGQEIPMRGLAASAIRNPNFVNTLVRLEQMDMQELLAAMRASPGASLDPAAQFELMTKMMEEIRESTDRAREFEEAGQEGLVDAELSRLRDMTQLFQRHFPNQTGFIGQHDKSWLIGHGVEFSVLPNRWDAKIRQDGEKVLDRVRTGEVSVESIPKTDFFKNRLDGEQKATLLQKAQEIRRRGFASATEEAGQNRSFFNPETSPFGGGRFAAELARQAARGPMGRTPGMRLLPGIGFRGAQGLTLAEHGAEELGRGTRVAGEIGSDILNEIEEFFLIPEEELRPNE